MARKATRLRFTEDELANPKIKKAASKAEKAADQADRAAAKTPKKRKLKLDTEKVAEGKVHLTFEKQEIPMGELTGRGNRFTRSAAHSAAASVSGTIHGQVSANNQDDNTAVQAVNTSAEAAEAGAHAVDHAIYSKKLKSYEKAGRLQTKSDAANVEAIYQQRMAEHPEEFSNPVSRWQQKKAIRKEYAAARRAEETAVNASTAAQEGAAGVKSLGQRLAGFKDKALEYVAEHPQAFLVIGALVVLLIIVSSALSSCSAFLPGGSGAVIATTFTANDEDTSTRKIFLPKTVAEMLVEWKRDQDFTKEALGSEYADFDLVMANGMGMPTEQSRITALFAELIEKNDLPKVVFHSLRHSSITYKLKLNGGDIKSVQGDSGHAQAQMVTDQYSHILDDDRKNNAALFERAFYSGKGVESVEAPAEPEDKGPAAPAGVDSELLAKILSNPEMAALLTSLVKSLN